jgi:octopine/nopaline transport system permease protein
MADLGVLFSFGPHGWSWQLLGGMAMTLRIGLAAFAISMALGLAGAAAKLSGSTTLRAVVGTYTTLVRGVPEILVILLLFYGGATALRAALNVVGIDRPVEVNGFVAGVTALGFISGAYSTEVFRGAILAVPGGQIEAARAVGMSRLLVFRRVLLPQLLRFALPGLGNLWLIMLKDTALVSVIGLADLLRSGQMAAGSTRLPFIFYIAVALLFLVLTVASMALLQRAERHLNRGFRRA